MPLEPTSEILKFLQFLSEPFWPIFMDLGSNQGGTGTRILDRRSVS